MSNLENFVNRVGTAEPSPRLAGHKPLEQPTYASEPAGTGSCWARYGDVHAAAPTTVAALAPGVYSCLCTDRYGPSLGRRPITTDGLVALPDPTSARLLAEFATFWTRGDRFRSHGFLHKRGFLLWGPPGSGKTSSVAQMLHQVIDAGGVVVLIDDPVLATMCLSLLRKIEPERPVVCVLEDIDAIVQRHGEATLLALLDGEAQIDRVVFLATTNYPEMLDKRFVDRPSRFDTIEFIGMPSADAREAYFRAKDNILASDPAEMANWVRMSKGFSVAHLREMLVAVRCLDQRLPDVVARLELMHERRPTSEDTPDRENVGFVRVRAVS